MQKLLSLGTFLMLLVGWACTQVEDATTVVATEEVVFVSGEKMRVLGRLITNQPISASDHGFQLSTSENFSNPIIISLGEKSGPGRFIGETSGLTIRQNYFVKAFVNVDGVDLFGETLEIQTLSPAIESFSPTFSKPGVEMLIIGRNFTPDTRVFFGDQEATVLEIVFDSRLKVRIPEASESAVVPLTVQVQNEILEASESFEYQTGKYTLVGQFPESPPIYENAFFQNQNGFYMGWGKTRQGVYFDGFQRFDPESATWNKVNFPGENREGAFSTSNFLGGGAVEVSRDFYDYKRDFWKIDGDSFQRLPDLPTNTFKSIAFELNGQLYITGGADGAERNIRKFNPITNSWSFLSSTPIDIDNSLAWFTYQNKGYFITPDNVIWEFDPIADTWMILTNYPGSAANGFGLAQVIGDKVYIGLYRRADQLLELDLNTLVWKSKNTIPGFSQSINSGIFTFDGQIYILRCPEKTLPGTPPMELYSFEPNGI